MKKSNYSIYTWLAILILIAAGTIVFEIKNSAAYTLEPRSDEIAKNKAKDNDTKETVGWIRVQGTNIDFPVLYAPDYDFAYEAGKFAWTEAKFDDLNNKIVISGHNIKNMSKHPLIADPSHDRFEQLMSFVDYDFAKENQFIQYTFNGKDYLYKIFSVSFLKSRDIDLYNSIEYPLDELRDYINLSQRKSIYEYNTSVNENDKILTLATCIGIYDDEYMRIAVNARLVHEGEKVKLADVKTTSVYNDIEAITKGGDLDEEIDEV